MKKVVILMVLIGFCLPKTYLTMKDVLLKSKVGDEKLVKNSVVLSKEQILIYNKDAYTSKKLGDKISIYLFKDSKSNINSYIYFVKDALSTGCVHSFALVFDNKMSLKKIYFTELTCQLGIAFKLKGSDFVGSLQNKSMTEIKELKLYKNIDGVSGATKSCSFILKTIKAVSSLLNNIYK